jgi:hypothetical protein
MITLQIEHKIFNFEDWKKAFDADPIDRRKSGVKQYLIFRPTDDPNYVIIHLGFNELAEAKNALKALQQLWQQVDGSVMVNPQTRFIELVEAVEL